MIGLRRVVLIAAGLSVGLAAGAPDEAAEPAPAGQTPVTATAPDASGRADDAADAVERTGDADDAADETGEAEAAPAPAEETAPSPADETAPVADEPIVAPAPSAPGPTDAGEAATDGQSTADGAGEAAVEPAAARPPEGPPIADEAGVLPGRPGDEPGVGLPVDTAPAAPANDLRGVEEPAKPAGETAAETEPRPDVQGTIFLLGTEVPPGTTDWLSWSASESFEGISTPTPVLVVNGRRPGPTLCLTAAVHGDELNGVEMVRRVMYSLEPEKLNGAVIGAPIVNLHGFRRSSRYLPDRRDLNRFFPGSQKGSSASRIAYSFFHEIILHCDALVDLHTGSFHRSNLTQLRADLNIPEVVELTKGFGATVVLHSKGAHGTLRRAATDRHIPAVTLEAGEPMRLQPKEVAHGVKGIESLLDRLGMIKKGSFWGDPQPVYYNARWVRANTGGILFSNVNLGERVRKDEVLGTVTDPITNKRSQIVSPWAGRIIGRALNQVVMPGFAAFHIGIQTSEQKIQQDKDDGVAAAAAEDAANQAPGSATTEPAGASPDVADEQEKSRESLEEDERPE